MKNRNNVWLLILVLTMLCGCAGGPVTTAGTFAPEAKPSKYGVVQVYSARTKGAKKALAVHTWISVKKSAASEYTSYEVIGWRLRRTGSALVVRNSRPDRDWWGHQPTLLLDKRGPEVDGIIEQIQTAVVDYPFKDTYQAYPGPNSNTFTAYIAQQVPELGLDLPSTAIGKDYRELNQAIGLTPSGTGLQASLWGLLGLSAGYEEGLELNILGLNFELDIFDLAIELPGIGRIGADEVNQTPNNEPTNRVSSQTVAPADE